MNGLSFLYALLPFFVRRFLYAVGAVKSYAQIGLQALAE